MLRKVLKIREILNTSRNLLIKTFYGFRLLENTLWQKHENSEMVKNKKLSKAENMHG